MTHKITDFETCISHYDALTENEQGAYLEGLAIQQPTLAKHVRAVLIGRRTVSQQKKTEVEDERRLLRSIEDMLNVPYSNGVSIKNYKIQKYVGSGAKSLVYLAEHIEIPGKKIAIKVHPRSVALSQILSEVGNQAICERDSRIVRVYDFAELPDGSRAIFMDYVDGLPICEWAHAVGASLRGTVECFLSAAEAIATAHEVGVVHCDLKPGHILVTTDRHVHIIDFDVSVKLGSIIDEQRFTEGWASPQRRRGNPPAPSDDVYSLGVILNELVIGNIERPVVFSGLFPNGNLGGIFAIIRKCLAGEVATAPMQAGPEQRYVDATELVRDLRALLEGRPLQAVGPWLGYKIVCSAIRYRVAVSVAVGACVAGCLLGWAKREAVLAGKRLEEVIGDRLVDQQLFESHQRGKH
jgi:serine/threonine-protein kinase